MDKNENEDEAVKLLAKNKIPAAPVRNLEEVTRDEHMHERGMLRYVTHPIMGDIVLPTSPIRHHRSTRGAKFGTKFRSAYNRSIIGLAQNE